jgi:hypothetical protein
VYFERSYARAGRYRIYRNAVGIRIRAQATEALGSSELRNPVVAEVG